tara:strand:+ start:567 stop:2228 length:1662 start_codon:yes stop_codon:yes gene_type:complete
MFSNFWRAAERPLVQAAAAGFAILMALPASALEVTGSFSGWWGQPEQQNHGAIIAISRLPSGEKTAAVYWAHYNAGTPTWLIAQGPIDGDRIMAQVYEFDGISFMQPQSPEGDFGEAVGTMEVRFSDCINGRIMFDTDTVGAGEFPIARLSNQPGVACSGGISDDFAPDHMAREFVVALEPTGVVPGARGQVEFEMRPGRGGFNVDVENLPEGGYELRVGGEPRGTFEVFVTDDGTAGHLDFRSPSEPGTMLLDFDPRDRMIEVLSGNEVVLAAATPVEGHFMGRGIAPFEGPDHGRFETEIQLLNDGVYPDGSAEARMEMLGTSGAGEPMMEFDIQVRNIPVGSYSVRIGGEERGLIEVTEIGNGQTHGEIEFQFPDEVGAMHLEFDPRGAMIEILDGIARLFAAEFPSAGSDGGFGMGMGGGMGHGGGMGPGDDEHSGTAPGVDFAGIAIELDNLGVHAAGSAEAVYEQHSMRTVFRVHVENVPAGLYDLFVGGAQFGAIDVVSTAQGNRGSLWFGDPAMFNEMVLDFDPRGEIVEIRRDGEVIFTGELPI